MRSALSAVALDRSAQKLNNFTCRKHLAGRSRFVSLPLQHVLYGCAPVVGFAHAVSEDIAALAAANIVAFMSLSIRRKRASARRTRTISSYKSCDITSRPLSAACSRNMCELIVLAVSVRCLAFVRS